MSRRKVAILAGVLLGLCLSTADARAQGREKIAILGLELIDTGEINTQSAVFAELFTKKLRQQAAEGGGPYELAPNSFKGLLEMKLLSNCADEALGCMATIGRELNGDALLYGKVQRVDGQGYRIKLKLLDTRSKKVLREGNTLVPFEGAQPDTVGPYATRFYREMIGVTPTGSLVLRVSNAQTGTVYIDGERRGALTGGAMRIPNLAAGSHTVSVESEGYARKDQQIQIEADEELELELVLDSAALSMVDDDDGSRTGWKIAFWSATAATAVSGGAWAFTGLKVLSLEDEKLELIGEYNDGRPREEQLAEDDACADARMRNDAALGNLIATCDDGSNYATITNVLIGTTIASAVAAGFFFYKGYISGEEQPPAGEPQVSVEPVIGPDMAGAGMTIRF